MNNGASSVERVSQHRSNAEILILGSELLKAAFTASSVASGESDALLAEVTGLRKATVTLGTDAVSRHVIE
jgi:hypothetical protein